MNKNRVDFISKVYCLDLETTSVEKDNAEIIEFSMVSPYGNATLESLYKSEKGIPPEVSAITHLVDDDVKDKPVFTKESVENLQEVLNESVVIAHQKRFDIEMLGMYGYEVPVSLCSLRMAKKLYSNNETITAFNLQYLRYALQLDVDRDLVAHRATPDATVVAALLNHILDVCEERGIIDIDEPYLPQIQYWLEQPIFIEEMPFGKHKGKKLVDIPLNYWEWALGNMTCLREDETDYDPDFYASVVKVVTEKVDGH